MKKQVSPDIREDWEKELELLSGPWGYIDYWKAQRFIKKTLANQRKKLREILKDNIQGQEDDLLLIRDIVFKLIGE